MQLKKPVHQPQQLPPRLQLHLAQQQVGHLYPVPQQLLQLQQPQLELRVEALQLQQQPQPLQPQVHHQRPLLQLHLQPQPLQQVEHRHLELHRQLLQPLQLLEHRRLQQQQQPQQLLAVEQLHQPE